MTILSRSALVLAALLAASSAGRTQDAPPPLDAAPDEIPTHLVKVLRTSNKAQTNRYVPKVYEFQHNNPYAVIRFVRRVMEIEEGAWFSFANEDLNGGKLLVICPEYQIAGLDELMALIDREGLTSSSGSERVLYRLDHRDAFDPNAQAVAVLEGTPTVTLIPDDQINAWLVEDSPSGLERVVAAVTGQDGLQAYDYPTPQVEAQVVIHEIDLNDDGQIGLDYVAWKNGPGRNLFAVGAFAQKEKISTLNPAGALIYNSGKGTAGLPASEFESTGRNAAYLYDVPSAYFDFLVAKGQARILTQTKLVALNRTTASIEVGDEILFYKVQHGGDLRAGARLAPLDPYGDLEPFVDTSAPNQITDQLNANVVDHPDNRTVTPQLAARALGSVQTGLVFRVTPTINRIGCTLVVFFSVVNHTGYADDGTPVLASRSVDTVLKIPHDGRVITLGGMTRKRRVDSVNKMPWLGDIPVLGYLFGGESRLDQESMVIATITARVVPFGEQNLSDEELTLLRQAMAEEDLAVPINDPGFLVK